MKYTREELQRLQALPLYQKIDLSKLRIIEWFTHYDGRVCVSFSGGKDSTVLLHLVRSLYPDVPAVYVDTRLDFPEVRQHVKNTDNVIWLKPELNFRQVIDTYGFCYPNKDVATIIEGARRNVPHCLAALDGVSLKGNKRASAENSVKWKWLVDTDLKISSKCCEVMKERPIKKFLRENQLTCYVGVMAVESLRRRAAWYAGGCNSFNSGKSKPLSFWTQQDILRYIVDNDLSIPSVYGSINANKLGKLRCSGEQRTGCIFCPIGCHLDKVNKFQRLKLSHPQLYHYCMNELGLDDFLSKVGVDH